MPSAPPSTQLKVVPPPPPLPQPVSRSSAHPTNVAPPVSNAPIPEAPISKDSAAAAPPPSPQNKPFPWRRWLWQGGICAGLTLVSLVPIPYGVRGDIKVMATASAYYPVFMPEPGGTIDTLLVTANQDVAHNQVVAHLSSDTLNHRLEAVAQDYQQLEATLILKEKQVETAQAQLAAALSRASGLNQEMTLLATAPPEIVGIQGEIQSLNAEIQGLERNLSLLDQEIEATAYLVSRGAAAELQLHSLQAERNTLENTIHQRQGQIHLRQASITTTQEQRHLQAQRSQTQVGSAHGDVQAAQAQLEQSLSDVAKHQDLLLLKAQELQQLQQQQTNHGALKTQLSGTVVTDQATLDQLKGKYLDPGEPILEVIKLDALVIETWIRQEDRQLIETGMAAQVYPQNGSLEGCQAEVTDVAARSEFRPDQQRQMIRIALKIAHCDQQLQVDMTGHARIKTHQMPIYRVLLQEILKLIPINKFR